MAELLSQVEPELLNGVVPAEERGDGDASESVKKRRRKKKKSKTLAPGKRDTCRMKDR